MMRKNIYLFSDATGETAEIVVNAVKSQFRDDFNLRKIKRVTNAKKTLETFEQIKEKADLIVFTFVDKSLSELLKRKAEEEGIPTVDILGPMISSFEMITGRIPEYQPGISRELDNGYFKKVDALEYSVRHDDGKSPEGIKEADVVILGVSRTSKTPLSIYLANRGIKVANIPIIYGMDLPTELYDFPRRKVIGLTISPTRLLKLRQKRMISIRIRRNNYADLKSIVKEISFAEDLYKKLGCPMIDITQKAIEETSDEIIKIISREE